MKLPIFGLFFKFTCLFFQNNLASLILFLSLTRKILDGYHLCQHLCKLVQQSVTKRRQAWLMTLSLVTLSYLRVALYHLVIKERTFFV